MRDDTSTGQEPVTSELGFGVQLAAAGSWFTSLAAGDFTDPSPVQFEQLARSRNLQGRSFARSRQVHGSNVRFVDAPGEARPDEAFDGQVTSSREVICAVRTADCLPVALLSQSAAGVVHAGWRGLAAGVIAEGVLTMRRAGEGEITAVIGPGARPCCYEAGAEVHEAFASLGAPARVGENANLPWIAGEQLRAAGVSEQIDSGLCTICSEDPAWHSYRREGQNAGRSLALAWLS